MDKELEMIREFENMNILTDEEFLLIKELSNSKNDFVRSQCAALLINFVSDESLNILLILAKDKDAFVRTEAYDSLSIFIRSDVERFLYESIITEKDNMAQEFAIISWANIVVNLDHITNSNIEFVNNIESVKNDISYILTCCYVQYRFGNKEMLQEILGFFSDEDYHVRCSIINILYKIIDDSNNEIVCNSIEVLLDKEESYAVISSAEDFC